MSWFLRKGCSYEKKVPQAGKNFKIIILPPNCESWVNELYVENPGIGVLRGQKPEKNRKAGLIPDTSGTCKFFIFKWL